jgi:hypothetical protein
LWARIGAYPRGEHLKGDLPGEALALLINSNIRRERPGKNKCPSLFALLVNNKEKSFITFITGVNVIKRLYFFTDETEK